MIGWAKLWKVLVAVLTTVIPVPLVVILAVAGWLWLDTGSRVRQAVDQAVSGLVSGARIDALEAQLAAERELRAFVAGQRDEARRIQQEKEAALAAFREDLSRTEQENEKYEAEIQALRDNPRAPAADDAYVDGMRDK